MEQYISKAALAAEIEKRRDGFYILSKSCEKGTPAKAGFYAQAQTLEGILSFINTLEVKEVDLTKELDNYFAKFKGLEKSYWNWRIDTITVHAQGIYDFAQHFFELGLKAQKGE